MKKDKENNNLQVDMNNISYKIKRYINKISDVRRNRKIIEQFSIIKQYDVLSIEAFKIMTKEMIDKNQKGTVFIGDINDLYQANKNRSKKEVNVLIKDIIDKIKQEIESNNYSDYKMGKMGDELYVYIPNEDLTNTHKLYEKMQSISSDELSISVGASDNLSKGLTYALEEADIEMCKNKREFKLSRLKDVCGDNIDKVIKLVISTQLDSMRINLDNLKKKNKGDLKDTYNRAIEQVDVDLLIENIGNDDSTNNTNTHNKKDELENLQKKYESEAYQLYGSNASDQEVKDYVLSNILSRHPVEGIQSSTFFEGLGYKKVQKDIRKYNPQNENIDLIVTDLSGLKAINDTYGHEEGNYAIYKSLKYFRQVLKELGIVSYSDIITKGGGSSFVITRELTESQKEKLQTELLKYDSEESTKRNLSFSTSIQDIDRDNINGNMFIDTINSRLEEAEDEIKNQSFDKKIRDVDTMKLAIEKIYKQLMSLDDIQLLCDEKNDFSSKVLSFIRYGFNEILEQQKEGHTLDRTPDEKSKEIEKDSKSDKSLPPL